MNHQVLYWINQLLTGKLFDGRTAYHLYIYNGEILKASIYGWYCEI